MSSWSLYSNRETIIKHVIASVMNVTEKGCVLQGGTGVPNWFSPLVRRSQRKFPVESDISRDLSECKYFRMVMRGSITYVVGSM